jgi:Omp85 superfamily domain
MICSFDNRRARQACNLAMAAALLSIPVRALAQDATGSNPSPQAAQAQPGNAPAVGPGILTEPRLLTSAFQYAIDKFGDGGSDRKRGWYPEFSNMITGSGIVSAGPGYRHWMYNDQAFLDASGALSWHLYKMAQVRFEVPDFSNHHFTVGSQAMYADNTQVNYFGIGPDSLESNQSQYQLESTDIVAYGAYRPHEWLSIGGKVGWLTGLTLLPTGGTFKPNLPEAQQVFPTEPGMQSEDQPDFLHTQASIVADTRNYPGHPTKGGLYRGAWTTYHDQSSGIFSFEEYEGEAMQFIPLTSENWILAFNAWALFTHVPNGHEIPFYFLPSLGGQSTLRGYSSFRFHDQNLAMVSVESRWALFTHVDGALFVDAGNVAQRAQDLNFDKTDVGAGLRLHTERNTWGRIDVAHGSEGWNFLFRTSDALRLSRVVRRTLAAPFVP